MAMTKPSLWFGYKGIGGNSTDKHASADVIALEVEGVSSLQVGVGVLPDQRVAGPLVIQGVEGWPARSDQTTSQCMTGTHGSLPHSISTI